MSMNLVDPSFELIDPNPDVHALFLDYNRRFFNERLLACEVRWSPQMKSCAGICSYEGHSGMCSIRLSKPLLMLRPRKDLVETLLHEMIHAFLFVTNNNRDRDGHGPSFLFHMNRINREAGTNITVYHTFHAEVRLYKTHHWRCNGPCRERYPFYGWVKRSMNRAPSHNDTWWAEHHASCGGIFIKVAEPEGFKAKKKAGDKEKPKKTDKTTSDKTVKTLDSWLTPTKMNGGQKLGGENADGKSKLLDQLESQKTVGEGGTTLGGATTGKSRLLDLYDNKEIQYEVMSLGTQSNPIQVNKDWDDRNDPNYQWQEGCGPMLPYEGPLETWEKWPQDEWESIPAGLFDQNAKIEEWEPLPEEIETEDGDWEQIPAELLKSAQNDQDEPQPKKKSPPRKRPTRAKTARILRFSTVQTAASRNISCTWKNIYSDAPNSLSFWLFKNFLRTLSHTCHFIPGFSL